jgi:hypothetical protein
VSARCSLACRRFPLPACPPAAPTRLPARAPAHPLLAARARSCTACLAKSTDDTGLDCVTEGAAASPSPSVNKPTAAPPPKNNNFVLPPGAAPPPATATPRDASQGSSIPLIPIIVAAIAGILVLAAIIAAVVIYRRRQEPPKFNNPTFDPAAAVEPYGSGAYAGGAYAGGAFAGGGYAGSMGYTATHPGSSSFVGSPSASDAGAGSNLQWAPSAAAPSVTSSVHHRI